MSRDHVSDDNSWQVGMRKCQLEEKIRTWCTQVPWIWTVTWPGQGQTRGGPLRWLQNLCLWHLPRDTTGSRCRGCSRRAEGSAHTSSQPTTAPTQGNGKGSSIRGPDERRTELPRGKGEGHRGGSEVLTQGGSKCQVLQLHITVQASPRLIKETPFLPGKGHSHIFKGHAILLWWWQMKPQTAPLPRSHNPFSTNPPTLTSTICPSSSQPPQLREETRPWYHWCLCLLRGPLITGQSHQQQEAHGQSTAKLWDKHRRMYHLHRLLPGCGHSHVVSSAVL